MEMEEDPLIGQTFYFTAAKPQVEDAPRGGNGSQVLPVAQLSPDFNGIPQDGMEYLFLVRREASTHAKVYRALMNPYETLEPEYRAPVVEKKNHPSKPSEEWKSAFLEKFKQTRFRMMTAPPRTGFKDSSVAVVDLNSIPAPKQESAWRIFINGKRSKPIKPSSTAPLLPPPPPPPPPPSHDSEMMDLEAAKAAILASLELDTPLSTSTSTSTTTTTTSTLATSPPPPPPEYLQLPQLPTPSLILSIPSTSLIHILSHFNEWFTERLETRQQLIDWVPSTIFAPTSLRTKQQKKKQQQTKISNNNNNNNGVVTVIKPSSPPSASFSTVVPKQEKKTLPPSPLPTAHEIHWILSLLSRLNDLLDGDDLSLLRQLSKTLVEMIELSENKKQLGTKDGHDSEEEELEENRARCWIIVAAISGIWKQEDLWNRNL